MEIENGLQVYYEKTEALQNKVNHWKTKLLAKKKKVSKLKNFMESSNSCTEIHENLQRFLNGLKFELVGFNEETNAYLTDWVTEAGGELVFTDFNGEVDYLITPCTGGNSRHRYKKHVSYIWLEDCLDQGKLLDIAYFHKIIHIDKALKPLEGVVTGLSGYTGREREFLNSLVESLGGLPQELFAKRDNKEKGARCSTHLICPEGVGQKYTAALKWKLPVINCDWLVACLREKQWVSESPFLLGDSTAFTQGKPMPVEAVVESSTVLEDKTLHEQDTVVEEVSRRGEVSFPGEVSKREELRRKSVDLTSEAGNREELRSKSLDMIVKSADLTKGSGNASRFTEADDTRNLEETRADNGPVTPMTNVSELRSMIDTPGAALDTPTLERLRPQPLNHDISATPQRWVDSQPSPSQVAKRKRDSVEAVVESSTILGDKILQEQEDTVASSPSLHRKIKSFVPPFKKGKENTYNEENPSPTKQDKRAISVPKSEALKAVKPKKGVPRGIGARRTGRGAEGGGARVRGGRRGLGPRVRGGGRAGRQDGEKASDIFNISDDPDVVEILKREKAEAKNVTGNAKKGSKFVKGVQKMIQFNQKVGQQKRSRLPDQCGDQEFESPAKRQRSFGVSKPEAPRTPLAQETEPLHDSPDSIPMSPSLMISPVLPRKLASLEEDEIDDDVENDSNEYVPDLDELLKLPERPADGSKTKDEILDEFDRQIAERQRLHEEEMARVEADIEAENQKRIQRKMRLKENAKLRNRLETELTETRLRSMFKENLQYLRDIWTGKEESSRHQAFHKSIRTRHALYYTIITDPFTDDQLDWTLDEIGKVWMSNRRDQLENKEYVWKVLLAECFIKFYMDFFNVSKNEAMTPLHKKDRLKEFLTQSDLEEDSD